MRGNDQWLRLLYISLELIGSSRVLAAGSVHNVLSVVTYQSVCLVWKFILTGGVHLRNVALVKTAGV